MRYFFDNSGYVGNSTDPGVYRSQAGGMATLGSASLRTPVRNLTPFSIQSPKIRAGCGGIDLVGGGLSWIDGEQIRTFLRDTVRNAESLIFMMAVRTVSSTISNSIETWAGKAMEISRKLSNSCEMAQWAVGGAAKQLGLNANACVVKKLNDDASLSYGEAQKACGLGDAGDEDVQSVTNDMGSFFEGNLAWYVMAKNGLFANDPELAQLLMNLTGTLIVIREQGNGGAQNNQFKITGEESFIALSTKKKEVINVLVKGGTIAGKRCADVNLSHPIDEAECRTLVDGEFTLSTGFLDMVKTIITSILLKIRDPNAELSATEIGLISSTTIPVYKLLNTAASLESTQFAASSLIRYSEIIAKDVVLSYLGDLMSQFMKAAKKVEFQGSGEKFMDNLYRVLDKVDQEVEVNYQRIQAELQILHDTAYQERILAGRLNGRLSGFR